MLSFSLFLGTTEKTRNSKKLDSGTNHIAQAGPQILTSLVQRYKTTRASCVERQTASSQVIKPAHTCRQNGYACAYRFILEREFRTANQHCEHVIKLSKTKQESIINNILFIQYHACVVCEDTRKYAGITTLHVLKFESSALHCFIDIFHYNFVSCELRGSNRPLFYCLGFSFSCFSC